MTINLQLISATVNFITARNFDKMVKIVLGYKVWIYVRVQLVQPVSQVIRVNPVNLVRREKLDWLDVQETKVELVIQDQEVLKATKVTVVLKVYKGVLDQKEIE